jgi:hypothetical protein
MNRQVRGKGCKLGKGKGERGISLVRQKRSKLGESCPKFRLSQDRLPIEPLALVESQVRGKWNKLGGLGEGECISQTNDMTLVQQ